MRVKNYLLGYENMYIMQDTEGFNFSLDSVLLPNFVTINKNITNVLDIGCGNAPIPLILSTKTSAHIVGVEIQKQSFLLAKQSVEINGLEEQISLINKDIKDFADKCESDTYDIITCNPPFFKINPKSNLNKNDMKTIARHEVLLNLEVIMKISRKLLKNNGIIGIVHRPERLVEILMVMKKYNIEPKKIRFVYPKKDSESNILLIEGKKNGKPGLKILDPLYVHEDNGSYTKEVLSFFEKEK